MNTDNVIINEELSKKNSTKFQVCDGFGCSNKPEENIAVSAGTFGTISLNLCSKCIILFKSKELSNPLEEWKQQKKHVFH